MSKEKLKRLAVGIAEAKVVLDVASNIIPFGLAASIIKSAATGTPAAVGQTAVEAELTDSLSGVRLMAAVDERAGRKADLKIGKWTDVKAAYDFWAERLRTRLTALRRR